MEGLRAITIILTYKNSFVMYTYLCKSFLNGFFRHYLLTQYLIYHYSPVYIDSTANIKIAAKRILWGKCVNAGQTCIAPDYILCSRQVQNQFLKEAETILKEFYGDKPKDSPDLCRIISERHYKSVVCKIKYRLGLYDL